MTTIQEQDSPVRLTDISRELGLSVSTVSRALNDSHEIGEATKRRVQAFALRVNYRPNLIARGLKAMNTRYLAILVPEISNSFFSEIVNGVEHAAIARGYQVLICQTHDSEETELNIIQDLIFRKADGLLLSSNAHQSKVVDTLREMGVKVPVVFFDRVPKDNSCHKVVCDNYQAAFDGTRELIRQGRRKIAHLAGPRGNSITEERIAGYSTALLSAGISVDARLIAHSSFVRQEALKNFRYLEEKHAPDAYFAASERLTFYCYEAIQALAGPRREEIKLVGFTNDPYAHMLKPALGAIIQPAFEMGKQAADLLLNAIARKNKQGEYGFFRLPAILRNL